MSYGYDANGNLISRTDARTIITNYSPAAQMIDALNRVKQITYSDGTPTVTFTYDTATTGKGRLAQMTSSVATAYGRVPSW